MSVFPWLIIGNPDPVDYRSTVRLRHDERIVIGYVRKSERRWFAETEHKAPIEGTYRTKELAVGAVLHAWMAKT